MCMNVSLKIIIVYKTGFWVCAVLVLSVIMYPAIEYYFIMMNATIIGISMATLFILNNTSGLSATR